MIHPDDWLAEAQRLPLDGQRRVTHRCGPGKVMVVEHVDEGWRAWCHRCHEPGFVPRPTESLSEKLARIAARESKEAQVGSTIVPPMPMNTDVHTWPLAARVWLYKAGFSNADIESLGIYYHEDTDRVVILMIQAGVLVYWQARACDWTPRSSRPKYLNPPASNGVGGVWFDVNDGPRVAVEDFLSAYRVMRAGYNSVTLLGTRLSPKVTARIMNEGKTVLTWLDNDQGRADGSNPGQHAAAVINRELRSLGVEVVNVLTDEDPKKYSRNKIAEILKGLHG